MKFSEKIQLMILKVTKKESFTLASGLKIFSQYIFRNIFLVKAWIYIFFGMKLNISFCQINNLSLHLNKNEHRKIC